MSFFSKMLDSFSGKDDDNYENEDYEGYEEDEEEGGYENAPTERQPKQEARPMEEKQDIRERQERSQPRRQHEQPQTRSYQNQGGRASVEMKVVKPDGKYEAGYTIGEHIIKGRTVIINFEDTSKEMQTRIMDFIIGLCFATNASVKKSSSFTYIISPVNVQVSSDSANDEEEDAQYKEMF